MSETVEILHRIRGLISDPNHWTKGVFATDQHGAAVPASDPTATCFCVAGAAMRVRSQIDEADLIHFREAKSIMRITAGGWLPIFNDDPLTTHQDVMSVIDKAIEMAGERE